MIKFFHQLFNPHCQHCADERREQRAENRYCASCESLANENSRLVRDNERLMDLLLEKPTAPADKVTNVENLKPIQTTRLPFVPTAVRRQMLEQESRHTQQLRANAPQPDSTINKDQELKELETELDNVRQEREKETVNK
jgi:hypothetical protein